jgi:multiple antibiotic resistance protein
MITDFFFMFLTLLVVIDPAGTIPLFITMTAKFDIAARHRVARRATLVAGVVGILFIVGGQSIFSFLGVEFADFKIAGGVVLLILSIIDLLIKGKPSVDAEPVDDGTFGVVPLAVPLIVGPATMTTSLLLVSNFSPQHGLITTIGLVSLALLVNLGLQYFAMLRSEWLIKIVGPQALLVVNKIVMILLAAIAVSLIRSGIMAIVKAANSAP